MNVMDKRFLSYIKHSASKKGSSTGRPEIDRPKLRELLYNSLAEGTVRWSHKLTTVDSDLTMHFSNGNTESGFDLIVGSDGAWSRVRRFVSQANPFYSGIAGHSFRVPNAGKTHPELYERVNRGSLFCWSDSKSMMAQYMGDGSLNIGTWAVRSEDWKDQYDVHNAFAVKEAHRKEYADWDPRLVAFTQDAEDHVVPRDLYMLPIGHKWEHVPGVTLIGDAAHLMTPFAGEGVNLAMEDSMKLAQAIISAASSASNQTDQLHKNVAEFEEDMFKRATETQQLTYDMMHSMFLTPGAPRNGIEKYILRAVEGEMGYWVTQILLKPLVYAYFFVFKLIW
jgi:2-polyprenyl-6-methoxyphenol hydroxylase-like FAD-dependent oxidoreductase